MKDDYFGPDVAGEAGTDDGGEDLFADLGRFETGAIPVDATVRRGRTIRRRRRVIGSGALAIAAALSIGVPVAVAGGGAGVGAASGPNGVYGASSTGGRVTVNPTPFSHGKGHFSGTVDGKKWSVDFDNKNCYYILWSCGFKATYPWDKYATLAGNFTDGQPNDYTLFLQKNVARVAITLEDGEVLSLEAVPVAGSPVVLFALPRGLGVSKIVLFDEHSSEIAYSMPFNIPGAPSAGGNWYLPGMAPSPDSGSVELVRGSTRQNGQEVITAYASPSGLCVVTDIAGRRNADCHMSSPVNGSVPEPMGLVVDSSGKPQHLGGESTFGLVTSNIDHMQLEFSDGTKSPVAIKSIDYYRFFAYIVPEGKQPTRLTAFDAAGKVLPVETNTQ